MNSGLEIILTEISSRTGHILYTTNDSEELRGLDPPVGSIAHDIIMWKIDYLMYPNNPIGLCSMYNYGGNTVEIGIRIWNKDLWDKGCGTKVLRRLIRYVKECQPGKPILVKTPVTNVRAIHVYEKIGFERLSYDIIDGHRMLWLELRR